MKDAEVDRAQTQVMYYVGVEHCIFTYIKR